MRANPARLSRLLPASLALLLLAACGGAPSSDGEAVLPAGESSGESSGQGATANQDAAQTASDSPAEAAADAGPHSARIEIDGEVHEFKSGNGGVYRNAVHDAPDIETITLETYTEANDLYVKADFNVAKGADPAGEYVAGLLGQPEHRGVAGHGQVNVAIETDPAVGRRMVPSGSGRFTVSREGDAYRVDFEIGGDGNFRAKDAEPVRGYLIVADLPRE